MDLTAYVFGDVALVTKLLSQVAMIFGDDSFATAMKVAVLAGVVSGLFGSLANRGQPNLMTFIWPFIVLALGVMPRVQLVLEDPAGGLSRVDKVPIIVAAPFSIITHVGRGITDLVEVNMGSPDLSISMDNGTIVGLRAPLAIEEVLTNEAASGAVLKLPNGLSLMSDTKKYVADCLAPALQKGGLSEEEIYNKPIPLWGATNYPFPILGSDGIARTCAEYYTAIFDQLETDEFKRSLRAAINTRFGRYKDDTTTGTRYEQALSRLVADPASFYRALVLSNALGKTAADYTVAGSGGSQEAALQDALRQRREASRGKAAMTFETIHQMVGFIEAWSFCIMPLMVLVMLLGPAGTRLGVKYFWLLVWVQLWFPTILIVLGYLDAQSLNLATKSVGTIAGANAFLESMLKLQDVGYMYLSMATMLSMFLIYGASAVFGTALQSSMDGGKAFDPKKNEPDTLTRGPETLFRPSYEYANTSGYIGTDAARTFGNVTFSLDRTRTEGTSLQDLATFARTGTRAVANTTSVNSNFSEGTNTSLTFGTDRSTTVRHGQSSEMSTGSQLSYGNAMADTAGNRSIDAKSASTAMTGSLGVNGTIQGSAKAGDIGPFGVGGTVGVTGGAGWQIGRLSTETNETQRGTNEQGDVKQTQDFSEGSKAAASIDHGARSGVSDQRIMSEQDGTSGSQGQSASRTAQESASDTQTEASTSGSMVTRATHVGGIDGMAWANQIARSREGMSELKQMVHHAGIIPDVEQFMSGNRDRLDATFKDEEAKYAFSAQWVMQNGGSGGRSVEQRDALNALGDYFIDKYSFGLLDVAGPNGSLNQHGLVPEAGQVLAGFAGTTEDFHKKLLNIHDRMDLSHAGADVSDELDKAMFEMRQQFGGDNKAVIDSIFSTMRSALESREDFHDAEEAQGFFGKITEQGLWTALSTAGSSEEEYQNSILARTYADDKDAGGTAADLLERRVDSFGASGQINADGPAARYMAATQLYIGAQGAGDESMAGDFKDIMRQMERDNPALEGWVGEQIRGFAADGAMRPEGGVADRLVAAQAAFDFGARQAEVEQRLGIEINDSMTAEEIKDLGTSQGAGAQAMPTSGVLTPGKDIVLSFIGGEEAPRGYDQIYDGSVVPLPKALTSMTLGEILDWQDQNRAAGAASGAVGRYQFMGPTMMEMAARVGMDENTVFSPETQDILAGELLDLAGYSSFINGTMSTEAFANNVAGRWAALPLVSGAGAGDSAYVGVAGNKATTSVGEYLSSLQTAKAVELAG